MSTITVVENQPQFYPYIGMTDFLGGTSRPVNLVKTDLRAYDVDLLINRCVNEWKKFGNSTFEFTHPITTQKRVLNIAAIGKKEIENNVAVEMYLWS